MKRLYKCMAPLLLAICLLAALAAPSFAYSPAIRDIKTDVVLADDGTATVTQVWDVTVASGTEWYLVQGNMGDMAILDFSVSDETGTQYTNVGAWDVDRSLEEKAGQCGIVDKGGSYELCWGVGSYGDHTYTVRYRMTNLVKQYSDYSGFNVRFVNDQLSSAPEHISVNITKEGTAFTTEDTWVWAFGFGGEIHVMTDGAIYAESSQPLTSDGYVNIMAKFAPELFHPTSVQEGSFDAVQQQALEGSDYKPDGDSSAQPPASPSYDSDGFQGGSSHGGGAFVIFTVVSTLFPAVIFGVVMVAVVTALRRSHGGTMGGNGSIRMPEGQKLVKKNPDYCREIPFGASLPAAYAVLKAIGELPDEGALIGAMILRWIKQGTLRAEERETKGFLGIGSKTEPSLVMANLPQGANRCEQALYEILTEAAGADGILQEKELYKWAKRNYSRIEGWQRDTAAYGSTQLQQHGMVEVAEKATFFGLIKTKVSTFTPTGMAAAQQLLGFRQYLKDFTIINERQPAEVQLWDDYLVFATLYGIADEVAKEFKELYPRYFEDPNQYGYGMDGRDFMWTMIMVNNISRAARTGAQAGRQAAQSSSSSFGGGGGSSSFGGGGGFSGGGSGGGSR